MTATELQPTTTEERAWFATLWSLYERDNDERTRAHALIEMLRIAPPGMIPRLLADIERLEKQGRFQSYLMDLATEDAMQLRGMQEILQAQIAQLRSQTYTPRCGCCQDVRNATTDLAGLCTDCQVRVSGIRQRINAAWTTLDEEDVEDEEEKHLYDATIADGLDDV